MSATVRVEEYAPLGDVFFKNFEKDQSIIMIRFPKMNDDYRVGFLKQLNIIKELEAPLKLEEERLGATDDLYEEAYGLNKDLNFLKAYFEDAGLSTKVISNLKRDLVSRNIEGALLLLKDLKQFVELKKDDLVAEGMDPEYAVVLQKHYDSMLDLNTKQSLIEEKRKKLVADNIKDYEKLYEYISRVARRGKVVFQGSVEADSYTISKQLEKMRAPKKG